MPRNWGRLSRAVFGDFKYQPPGWLVSTSGSVLDSMRRGPGVWASIIVATGVTIAGGYGWYHWVEKYKSRPTPLVEIREITSKLVAPGVTPIVKNKPVVQPVVLDFSSSIAPLESVGKAATKGVTMKPAMPGEWKWVTDKKLVFQTSQDYWPAANEYTVSFDKETLPPATKLKEAQWKFTTPPLVAKVTSSEFYTDPKDPSVHQITVNLNFSHPVTKDEVEKHITLDVLGKTPIFNYGGKTPDTFFTVTEGAHQREYYVRTTRIAVPEKEDFVNVTLTKGLANTQGGAVTETGVTTKVRVPDVTTGFFIKEVRTDIVRTEEGEPEQFLFLETTGYVTGEELEKHVSVWLLPKDKAASPAGPAVEDYDWPNTGEITPAVISASKPIPLKRVEAEKDEDAPMAAMHAFKMQPPGVGRLFVRITNGVQALGGFRLGKEHLALDDVPELPKEVEIQGAGGVLALNGEKKLSLKYRGVQHLRITLARVPFSQINHLARLTGGDFESPYWKTDFDEYNISRVHREVRDVVMPNEYQANYSTFDFTNALNSQDTNDPDASRGLFFLTVEGVRERNEDEQQNEEGEDVGTDSEEAEAKWVRVGENVAASRFILVTDLGILQKRNADASREIFVQSLMKGEPAAEVKIITLAKNGEFLHETTTDAQGHASVPNVEHFRREKLPVCVIARSGNDVAFLPFHRPDRLLDFSRFDIEGVLASEKEALDGFLFTERGVYRPGDKVHVGGIAKRRDWAGQLDGLPLVLEVRDSKEELLDTQQIALSEDGFFDTEVETAEESPTGTYTARLYLLPNPDDEGNRILLSRTGFRVEDFQPDRMKLGVTLSTPPGLAWVQPGDVKATINLQTLFGMPAAKRRVTAKLTLDPANFSFPKFPDFTFHNRLKDEDEEEQDNESAAAGTEVQLGEQTTDDNGNAVFNLALERFSDGVFSAEFFTEGFEPDGGRSVRGAQTFLVAPLPYVVGWKADGDLSYIGLDTPRSLKMIAVGPDQSLLAVPGLTQHILHIKHVSVLTKQENGNYAYVSTKREQSISEGALPLAADGASFTLPTNKAGEYRFELRDGEGNVVCATAFTVVGKGDAERSLERDAELEMKLARTSLQSGQPLEFSLRAPFTGAGLATIERDRVLGWQWIKQGTPSATHSIMVPEGLEGTGYVNVSFVRALDSPEVFTSPLSYAVQPFAVDENKRRMLVELDAPQRVKPGTTMTIGFKTTKPGRIVVYAVDEGIHQVTNYKLPDPLKHFMRKRALEVESEQILDLILPEFSQLMKQKAFGGSEDVALKMHLNPFKRRKEAPVVFWSGLVECGPDRQEVTYDVPDYFAGSLKIMAVAVSEDIVGTAQAQATVKGPFVLTPNAPFFAAPGDEFTASLTVANNLEGPSAPGTIALKVEGTEHLVVLPPLESNLEVGPGKEATARFKVRVKGELGGAELTFHASAGGEEAKRSTTLSVRPATPYMTHVQSGYFRLGKQDIAVNRDMFPEFRKTSATVSTAPLGLARGLESYLREYPYGCSEQITSRAMSRLLLADEVDFGFDKAEANEQLDAAFMLLRTRQHGNGGFGYWDGFCDAKPDFLSVYVTEFLTEARDAGYAVPSDILDAARNRMKQMARAKTANLEEANFQAAAIYLLTRNGEVTTNQVLNLRDTLEKEYKDKWEGTLSAAYLASTYMLLKQEKEGRTLMDLYRRKSDPKPFFERWLGGWWSDPQVRNAQAFALMCRHFPNIAGDFGYKDLAVITEPIAKHRFNTISSATSIMALKAYTALAKKSDVKLSITEVARAAGVEPKLLVPPSAGILNVPFGANAGTIRFNLDQGNSDLGAFYQVVEAGFEKGDAKDKITDGFEVFRELMDKDGKPIEKLKVGQSATVKLVIRNISPEDQTNVALLDLLPGSFEVEQGTLRPGRNTMPGADFVEVREDRNVFFTNVRKGDVQVFTYRIKPIAAGTFVIPPVYAESMYDQNFKGRALGGKLVVEAAQ
ncbi:hypothetical protein DES53_113112 [Roseimicrobium gellanilyticum]|uniref:Alpha-2-macroglobulin family protein n=2 Tax=Roseimicrobium gellanilyticum TaxID=748857 RepID=A0A366H6I7_9BACT|nr:hypothetical protein DES53_113112 [Roseimicrobium gellanilyticum]